MRKFHPTCGTISLQSLILFWHLLKIAAQICDISLCWHSEIHKQIWRKHLNGFNLFTPIYFVNMFTLYSRNQIISIYIIPYWTLIVQLAVYALWSPDNWIEKSISQECNANAQWNVHWQWQWQCLHWHWHYSLATLRGETCNGQITNGIKRSTIALFDFVFSINRIPQNASHTNLLLVLLLVYFGII